MSTPYSDYPRGMGFDSFEEFWNKVVLNDRIREGEYADEQVLPASFRWSPRGLTGERAANAGLAAWRDQAFVTGQDDFKSGGMERMAAQTQPQGMSDEEWDEKENNRAKALMGRRNITYFGQDVKGINYNSTRQLFQAEHDKPEERWDCVRAKDSNGNWNWFCYYNEGDYKKYQNQLRTKTGKDIETLRARGALGRAGTRQTREEAMAAQEKLEDINRRARAAFDKKYNKKELNDPKDVLKVRNLNAQAALILGMPQMVKVNGTGLLEEVKNSPIMGPQEQEVIKKLNSCALINYNGSPEALVNILANPYDMREFLCASPAELSHLQPYMQFYMEGKDSLGNTVNEEVCFTEHTLGSQVVDLAKARRSKAEVAKKLLESRGVTGTGVGIKSFNWDFHNKHQGDKTVKANLVLYFANVTELLNKQYLNFVFAARPPKSSPAAVTTETWRSLQQAADSRVKFMAELDFSNKDQDANNTAIEDVPTSGPVSEDAPILKVAVGWADPGRSKYAVLKGKQYDKFHEAVTYTKRMIILKCHQFDLDFQQNGSVQLTLEYIGGIDAFLSDPDTSNVFEMVQPKNDELMSRTVYLNIFPTDNPEEEEINELFARSYLKDAWEKGYLYKRLQDQNNRIMTGDKKALFGVSKAGLLYELKTIKMYKKYFQKLESRTSADRIKEFDKYEEVIKTAINEVDYVLTDLVYSSFMDTLTLNKKVYYATVRKKFITGVADSTNVDLSNEIGRRLVLGNGVPKGLKINFKGGASARALQGLRDRWQAAADASRRDIIRNSGDRSSADLILDPSAGDCIDNETEQPNQISLFYIKLGDLIDTILCGLPPEKRPTTKMILGSFYPSLVGIPNVKDSDLYALADLPISLDYFGHWFMINYIAIRKKPKVSFRRFLDSLLMDLVAPLFNGVLYDKTSAANKGRFTFSFSSIATPIKLPQKADITGNGGDIPRLIDENDLRAAAKEAGLGALVDPTNQTSYLLAYVKQLDPKLCGDPIEDHKRGIMHLLIGTDRGIVKNFQFSQMQNQYFQAAKIEEGNQAGGLFLPQNAVLTCVGNTFFRNGQKVYINADFGMGDAAAQLGIGGYYTIVAVENSIEPGKFETRLHCTFTKPKWSGCAIKAKLPTTIASNPTGV
jgi:hypothetical protein